MFRLSMNYSSFLSQNKVQAMRAAKLLSDSRTGAVTHLSDTFFAINIIKVSRVWVWDEKVQFFSLHIMNVACSKHVCGNSTISLRNIFHSISVPQNYPPEKAFMWSCLIISGKFSFDNKTAYPALLSDMWRWTVTVQSGSHL